MCSWKEGEMGGGGNGGRVRGLKIRQMTLSMGPIRVEVRKHVQGATIPSKQVNNTLNICKCHACKKRDE
jgi:hypothetical protein